MSPELYKSVQERVREKITSDFINMIPPETWAAMVKKEMDQFCDVDFPALVKKELTTFFSGLIKEEMSKPEWQGQWKSHGMHASPIVLEIMKQAAPEIVAAMFGNFAQNLVLDIRSGSAQLRSY